MEPLGPGIRLRPKRYGALVLHVEALQSSFELALELGAVVRPDAGDLAALDVEGRLEGSPGVQG